MLNGQLSFDDLFNAVAPEPVQQDAPAADAAGPVPVSIQASMICADGGSFRIYGNVRTKIILQAWRPTARDVLELFPISFSHYLSRGMLNRGDVIDLFVHELDGDGNMLHMLADAHVTITGGELMDAAKSF